jgi:hypothetical protein
MSVALNFVKEMKVKLSDEKLKTNLKLGLIECIEELQAKTKDDTIYALGFYCGNSEFLYAVFTANTLNGLQESFLAIDNDETEEDPESSKSSIRWNAADWKYHKFHRPQTLIDASAILGEINDTMYNFGSCTEPEYPFSDAQLLEKSNGKKTYEIDPNITYYEFAEDVYYPILEELYQVLNNVLAEVKSEMNLSDDIFISLFAGDASYDFMIQQGARLNSKATLRKVVKEIEEYGELVGYDMFDEDYQQYIK